MTRTHDAIGMVANAGVDGSWVQNDFDNAQIFREIGEVEDELGNVFVRIPKFYIKKQDGGGFKTWQVSKTQYPGFYLPWCFWDFTNNRELPFIDVGKYKASLGTGDKLESKPNLHPLASKNIVDFRTYATNNGKGYQQLDIHVVDVLQTLFYVEFATLHSQSVMQGFTTGQYSSSHTATIAETAVNRIIVANSTASGFIVGQSIGIGSNHYSNNISGTPRLITNIVSYDTDNTAIEFDGDPIDIAVGDVVANRGHINGFSKDIVASSGSIVSTSDGKYPMMYRGIESLYGDIWQFVDGVNINEHQAWFAKNAEDYASNVFASPYEQVSYINHNANGYPIEMGYDKNNPSVALPTTVGGGSTTYYSDYYYQSTGQRIARVGGSWGDGSTAGLSSWYLNSSSSDAYVSIGGRLLKKPL
ncbi:hypothetical protein [Alkalihalobacillus sp. BA299]|uniref:hypothetical protein n=1 Tax=Alkalihalobacillus sp. BA299 TaxID=2815938 RepID=UPI001AD9C929|nr:hypothetical protein [Alkalihalobacillus sp. BA299]